MMSYKKIYKISSITHDKQFHANLKNAGTKKVPSTIKDDQLFKEMDNYSRRMDKQRHAQ